MHTQKECNIHTRSQASGHRMVQGNNHDCKKKLILTRMIYLGLIHGHVRPVSVGKTASLARCVQVALGERESKKDH